MGCHLPPPYECRTFPEELDFGEVPSFGVKRLSLPLDFRDELELSALDAPFSATVDEGAAELMLFFTPSDAKLHLAELRLRLSTTCEEQTVRLRGLGSGSLETRQIQIDFGDMTPGQPVERLVPLTNTRRQPTVVSTAWPVTNDITAEPSHFTMQTAERREVSVRLTCSQKGPVSSWFHFRTDFQTLVLRLTGACRP